MTGTSFVPQSATDDELVRIEAFMTTVLADVHQYWRGELSEQGLQPTVFYDWVRPAEHDSFNGCAANHALVEASYCPSSDVISISDLFALGVWDEFGDMAVAQIIAHEYAHNLQAETGELGTTQIADSELQADCLSGRWSRSAVDRGVVDEDDAVEAATFFTFLGDNDFESESHHGTPRQRMGAFYRGYNGWSCPAQNIRS